MSHVDEYPLAVLNKIINFHNLNLLVYKFGDIEYVPAKSITDAIGIDWRNVKRNFEVEDNKILYGVIRLITPKIDNLGGLKTSEASLSGTNMGATDTEIADNSQFLDILCMRLDRVHMYLARVNTSRIRANGNIDSADYLLSLQTEWAQALHDYETHGIAIKSSLFNNTKQLKLLTDIYKGLNDKQQKHVVSQQIDACLGITRAEDKDLLTGL
ncbi:hypothetical protein [Psychrobacter sp. 72-O-c]|uniref:hypothetical protein n=1 Tax=Psychrobacter sp. 72-O-c TaxID=2774125 RepID=UPI00191AADD7|nr:hypothetical protein [Psychrobacter sp. 72-O-c]